MTSQLVVTGKVVRVSLSLSLIPLERAQAACTSPAARSTVAQDPGSTVSLAFKLVSVWLDQPHSPAVEAGLLSAPSTVAHHWASRQAARTFRKHCGKPRRVSLPVSSSRPINTAAMRQCCEFS